MENLYNKIALIEDFLTDNNIIPYTVDGDEDIDTKTIWCENKIYTSINEFKKYLYEEKDKEITPVIFRYDEKHDEIYAIFPFEIVDTNRNVMTYAHIGQHGVGDYEHMMNTSREATPEEYSDLKNELENRVGYNLKIITDKKEEY